ncbi:hypothetical protein ACOJIU_18400 (plasmid) [Carnobacterium maltaromaticum]|uniref:hypothetical protein n=1 Tax=Carnobacterium maltaromaticum TaxID=2751 RepID=UPI003450F96F
MSENNSLINKIALSDFNYYQYSGGFKNETKKTIKLIKTIMSQMSYDELESSNVYLDLETHCYYSFKSYCPYCGEDYDAPMSSFRTKKCEQLSKWFVD